jgi:hypothetical protein
VRQLAAIFKHVAGTKGRKPDIPVLGWPLVDGLASTIETPMGMTGHRSRSFNIVLSKCRTAAAVSSPV